VSRGGGKGKVGWGARATAIEEMEVPRIIPGPTKGLLFCDSQIIWFFVIWSHSLAFWPLSHSKVPLPGKVMN